MIKKTLLTLLLLSSMLLMPSTQVHAQVDCTFEGDNVPLITSIVCPLTRAVNILVLFAGVAFSLMVIVTAYKYATSLGDPKAAMGAQATLTNAVLGFVVVIGFFVIFSIVSGFFGIRTYSSPAVVFEHVQCGVYKIFSCSSTNGVIVSDLKAPTWCICQ